MLLLQFVQVQPMRTIAQLSSVLGGLALIIHMIRFVKAWPEQAQVTTLAQRLGWSHFKEILYLQNEVARQFYAEMCRPHHGGVV